MKKQIIILFLIFIPVLTGCKESSEDQKTPDHIGPGCGQSAGLATGEYTIISNDVSREYYLKIPSGYNSNRSYPVIFAFHGLGGNYNNFVDDSCYNLESSVGDEAILVYPNALEFNGETHWDVVQWDDNNADLAFFDDLYKDIESSLCIDKRKVFAAGHSNGAVFSNMLGWNKGHIIRAIAPVAGFLTGVENNRGQVAAIQVHGTRDEFFSTDIARKSLNFWIDVNDCNGTETYEGIDSTYCVAYPDCDTNFPVQYCEHDLVDASGSGHAWPDFAGDAIWNFFKSLPDVLPAEDTGSFDSIQLGIITFEVNYPLNFTGTPYKLALGLYPPDTDPSEPLTGAPSGFLNLDFSPGDYTFGETVEYNNISTDLSGIDPGNYLLAFLIYVEGSSYPMPTGGMDYIGYRLITITEDTVVITLDTPIEIDLMLSY